MGTVDPLPQQSLLSTFAEVSIAVVGFALVADILRLRSPEEEVRAFSLRGVAEIGLLCTIGSALPLVIREYGVSVESTWRLASVVLATWSIGSIILGTLRFKRDVLLSTISQHRFISTVVYGIVISNVVLVLINVLAPDASSGARYTTWILLALLQAGVMFLFAIFQSRERGSAA